MYQTLKDSLISLNIHIDVAGGFAGNMRMYEATGCGSLLFTEMTDNLPQIFDIKKEVVGYTDQDDLEKKLEYFNKIIEATKENKSEDLLSNPSPLLSLKFVSALISKKDLFSSKIIAN